MFVCFIEQIAVDLTVIVLLVSVGLKVRVPLVG